LVINQQQCSSKSQSEMIHTKRRYRNVSYYSTDG